MIKAKIIELEARLAKYDIRAARKELLPAMQNVPLKADSEIT